MTSDDSAQLLRYLADRVEYHDGRSSTPSETPNDLHRAGLIGLASDFVNLASGTPTPAGRFVLVRAVDAEAAGLAAAGADDLRSTCALAIDIYRFSSAGRRAGEQGTPAEPPDAGYEGEPVPTTAGVGRGRCPPTVDVVVHVKATKRKGRWFGLTVLDRIESVATHTGLGVRVARGADAEGSDLELACRNAYSAGIAAVETLVGAKAPAGSYVKVLQEGRELWRVTL